MITFLYSSSNDNRYYRHRHSQRKRECDYISQVKLLGSLAITMPLLLLIMMTTVVDSLPTPSRVNNVNNQLLRQKQSGSHIDRYYFEDNDQLLADLWLKLCASKISKGNKETINTSSDNGRIRYATALPTASVDDKVIITPKEQEMLIESLQRLLRDDGINLDFNNLVSVTCAEEPKRMPEEEQVKQSPLDGLASFKNRKLLLYGDDDKNDDDGKEKSEEILQDGDSLFPSFSNKNDADIQRQVIFIQIPETMISLHVHQPPPKTAVYVLPPEEDTHFYRITDMRGSHVLGGKRAASNAPPITSVHFLTNFGVEGGSNNTNEFSLRKHNIPNEDNFNLPEQFQSIFKNRNYDNVPVVLGVGDQTIPTAPIATFTNQRFLQPSQKRHQKPVNEPINFKQNGASHDFEIWPAVNGYFFH